jgi:HSP20 family protein
MDGDWALAEARRAYGGPVMARERDLFANFERMRREMDELFGDVFGNVGLTSRRTGFSPAVDVFYADDPPRAVVHAELAGIDAGDLGLEIQGRALTLTGHRREADTEARVYQQLEIEHGPFRRTIELGAEVVAEQARATYQDGILRVELPLSDPQSHIRSVPIERSTAPADIEAS